MGKFRQLRWDRDTKRSLVRRRQVTSGSPLRVRRTVSRPRNNRLILSKRHKETRKFSKVKFRDSFVGRFYYSDCSTQRNFNQTGEDLDKSAKIFPLPKQWEPRRRQRVTGFGACATWLLCPMFGRCKMDALFDGVSPLCTQVSLQIKAERVILRLCDDDDDDDNTQTDPSRETHSTQAEERWRNE